MLHALLHLQHFIAWHLPVWYWHPPLNVVPHR